MDIFFNNENGPNFLFKNRGDGNFDDLAYARGIADERATQVVRSKRRWQFH